MEIKGAIFDLDGTLFDSMNMWDSIAEDYLKSRGIKPKEDIRQAVRAMSIQQVCEHFCSVYGLALTPDDITAGINGMAEDFYLHRVALKDGAAEALRRLKSRGVKMCVATATDRYLVEAGLRRTGISEYFDRVFTCTETGAGKDKPDIFLEAIDFLGTDINETVVFEDALYAIRTAKAAGFPVAAFYDEAARTQQDEIKRLADWYFLSFAEWNKQYA
ncbi:MAG: HAD family phosphatase [Clostridiales bacterium]|nr:HAD family phosphatase [Clostridiales bacterium]